MKGVIIATSERKSLMPLTQNVSKAMLPLLDCPLIYYAVEQMQQNGITDITVVLEEEDNPLENYLHSLGIHSLLLPNQGLALKTFFSQAKHLVLFSTVLLTDFSLKKLLNFHKKQDNTVTVVSHEISDKLPCLRDGIFFFSHKAGELLLRKGRSLTSEIARLDLKTERVCEHGFCNTISSIPQYRDAAMQLLEHPDFFGEYRGQNGVILKENTFLEVGAKIKPPVYIGENVSICKNAEILPYSIVCRNSVICESAKVSRSILMEGCQAKKCAQIQDSVLSAGVYVTENTLIPPGSIIAESLQTSCLYAPLHHLQFGAKGFLIPPKNSAEWLYFFGQITGYFLKSGIVGMFKDDCVSSQFHSHSLLSGLQSAGIGLYQFPDCTLSMAQSACSFYHLKAGCYIYEGKEGSMILLLDETGQPFPQETQASFQQFFRQFHSTSNPTALRKITAVKPFQFYYIPEITRRLGAERIEQKLFCDISSPTVREYLQKAATCHRVSLLFEPTEGVVGLVCNPSATEFQILDEEHHSLSRSQVKALISTLIHWEKHREAMSVRASLSQVYQYHAKHRISPHENDDEDSLYQDPIYLVLKTLCYLNDQKISLTQWRSTLKKSFRMEKTVTPENHWNQAMEALDNLSSDYRKNQGSYHFSSKKGTVTITRSENTLTIVSESDREEYAKELTDFYTKLCLPPKDKA